MAHAFVWKAEFENSSSGPYVGVTVEVTVPRCHLTIKEWDGKKGHYK